MNQEKLREQLNANYISKLKLPLLVLGLLLIIKKQVMAYYTTV